MPEAVVCFVAMGEEELAPIECVDAWRVHIRAASP